MPALDNRPDRQHLRRFGLTIATGMTVIGAVSFWRDHTVAPTMMWTAAVLIGVPALVAPAVLARVERAWLMFGNLLAWVNTRIILTVLFYVVVTPVGVCVRLFRDPLDWQLSERARLIGSGALRLRSMPTPTGGCSSVHRRGGKGANGYDDSWNFSVLPRFGSMSGRRR